MRCSAVRHVLDAEGGPARQFLVSRGVQRSLLATQRPACQAPAWPARRRAFMGSRKRAKQPCGEQATLSAICLARSQARPFHITTTQTNPPKPMHSPQTAPTAQPTLPNICLACSWPPPEPRTMRPLVSIRCEREGWRGAAAGKDISWAAAGLRHPSDRAPLAGECLLRARTC